MYTNRILEITRKRSGFPMLAILLFSVNLSARYSLTVGDPRNSWNVYPGTISESHLVVEPKGLFMEYQLYLSFSSDGSPWNDVSDTLEVVLDFELPENAVVFDSWIWIEGEPVRAKILDRWTASLIYEGIVKRRRDPSILTKSSNTQYQLRIFPMAGNEERKVKISYLVPCEWSKTGVYAPLPVGILNQSFERFPFLITATAGNSWENPVISGGGDLAFEYIADTSYTLEIIPENYSTPLEIGFTPPPQENGIFISRFKDGTEGIYQMALFPGVLLDTILGSKVAVLLDYDMANTHIGSENVLETTKAEMLQILTEKDSFNLIISSLQPVRFRENWVPATRDNIKQAFDEMAIHLSDYSNLGALLANGIGFVNEQGGEGHIVLISDGDQYDDFQVANNLIQDILDMMQTPIPIHISDYQSSNYRYYWFGDRYYMGNDYFYINLSKQTAGSYQRVLENHSLNEVIDLSLKYAGGSIRSFDLHTGMEEGFCHSRHMIGGNSNRAYIHDAILQVGKYRGAFPMTLALSGEYNGSIFSEEMKITEGSFTELDSMAEEAWTGMYIQELESTSPSNDLISEIIYYSLTERVLSHYTSFLCLEPGIVLDPLDPDEFDMPIVINVEELSLESDTIRIYPNPFTERLTVELNCTVPEEVEELAVYDLSGKLLYRFDEEQAPVTGLNVYSWDGCLSGGQPADPGIYLLVYQNGRTRKTLKVIKL